MLRIARESAAVKISGVKDGETAREIAIEAESHGSAHRRRFRRLEITGLASDLARSA